MLEKTFKFDSMKLTHIFYVLEYSLNLYKDPENTYCFNSTIFPQGCKYSIIKASNGDQERGQTCTKFFELSLIHLSPFCF